VPRARLCGCLGASDIDNTGRHIRRRRRTAPRGRHACARRTPQRGCAQVPASSGGRTGCPDRC
jgi:hypothetical protein